jgi:hypothetical protein
MSRRYRSYQGAPRVYLTHGLHDDGEWKRMWYCNGTLHYPGRHFWTWREAVDYALSLPISRWARWRRNDPLGRSGQVRDSLPAPSMTEPEQTGENR